ncbi:hypothetical protein VE03_07012 [Pseudogymnoascus sp. 23342-1-I1]|nr:hypothetical protein VE03_07012 [Pseudogymnoascus sp. 23342-1-I1]
MSNTNTPRNFGGQRTKGELSEQGAKSRASTIVRLKDAWGVSELIDIFPKEIRPKDDLGNTTLTNLRSISNLCADLNKAQQAMLNVCKNSDGSYKPFSFSQSKQLMEQLRDMKNMLTAGGNQSAKKKAATPKASTPATPANFDTSAPPSSPLKGKQVKKDGAHSAGEELLLSIGKASAGPTAAADEEEGDSIVVDTAPRQKGQKKARPSLSQAKHEQTLPLTPAATAPIAVMSAEGSQTPTEAATAPVAPMSKDGSLASGKAAKVPVAVMSTDGPQVSDLKAKPFKKAFVNIAGHDSDSEDSSSEAPGLSANILEIVNGNSTPTKAAGGGFAKSTKKPAVSRFTNTETTGRMVVPSRELKHPFSNKHLKRSEQTGTSNPSTDKPAQIKKPFTNLMTSVPTKPQVSKQPKRLLSQKGGDMKEVLKMDFQTEPVIQNAVDSSKGTQPKSSGLLTPDIQKGGDMNKNVEMEIQAEPVIQNADSSKKLQRGTGTPATEINNDVAMIEVAQVNPTDPAATVTRTQLPTSPQKKRTASTMLRAAEEPNPQAQRSIRARLEHAAPYSNGRAISDLLQFERVITTLTQSAMDSVTASSFADAGGRNGGDKKAEDSKEKYLAFLTAFMVSVGTLKGDLLEIAERKEEE